MITPYSNSSSGKKQQVEQMFNNIAPRYDLLNTLLSAGIHKRWRKKAIALLKEKNTKVILDLATGTGDFAIAAIDRKSTRLNSSHIPLSRMPSSA